MVHTSRALPLESLQLLVFDLDGTLIDSRRDLCDSVNATLENFGMKTLEDSVIGGYIGDGAATLIRRALSVPGELLPGMKPDDEEFFQKAFAFFLSYYRIHKLDYTYVYPGVFESLEALKFLPDGRQRAMACLTNKPVGPAQAICDALGLSPYFFSVYGGDTFATKKPDAQGLRTLMAEAGVGPEETLMVGDSDVDVKTARNAGAWALGCSFGLSPVTLAAAMPDVVVDHASEWAEALQGARFAPQNQG
ncbi:HAD family hydrolase [Acidicapsa ligni]|uniref:HAD family hydrolase n=1 Tax=Acidicapsa ligni TaxID=542300 RepID=UPI0021E004D3|nr:HAD-IA family hydrolase [Acidicapsa ligni]